MDKSLEPKFIKSAPYDRANIFSKLIFGYTASTLLRGWRQGGLQVEDLYQSPKDDVVEKVARSLLLNWDREQAKCAKGSKTKPSFGWTLFRSFFLCYLPPLTIYLITECAFRVAQPLLLGRVIRYFGGGSDDQFSKKISYFEACLTAGALCLMLLTQLTINHPTMLHLKRLGMRLRVACCALLYQKSLRLNRTALGKTSVAQTVNMMSNDCNRFDEFSILAPYVIIAPAHTILSLYFVYQYVGVASLAGMAFLVAFLPYQSAMGRLFSTVRFSIAGLTDARLRYLGEVISGIYVIKMYTWERSFAARIAKTRAKEVAQVAKACYLQAVNSSTYFIASKLVFFVIFLVYVLLGNQLNAEAVFACMSLLNGVQNSMTKYFPRVVGLGAEVRITCMRIEKFLLLEETTSNWESLLKKEKASDKKNSYKLPKPKTPFVSAPSLTIERITARWNADPHVQPTLSNVSTDRLVSGDLLAVVGSVGSGKSSLLMTLLKELPLQSGTINLEGSLAYASQEAWSFNDTIRNNILFGAPYQADRYRRVIEICALKRDLQLLPHSDQTLVGEKGVQLSGGQKARVNLARAVYRDADILLLDDPLSAVDANVAKHIFEQCIVGYLSDKIRILVTHQLQFVEKATKVLVLKAGAVLAYGTWTELQQQGVDFISILEKEEEEKKKHRSESDTQSLHSMTADRSRLSSVSSSVLGSSHAIADSAKRKSFSSSISSNLSSSQLSLNLLNQETVKVKEELAQVGSLDTAVYRRYIRASGAPLLWITMIAFTLISQSLFHGTDVFLTYWTTKYQKDIMPETDSNATQLEVFEDVDEAEQRRDIIIYSCFIVALFTSTIVRSFSFFAICNRASVRLHNDTFAQMLRAPVAFYDSVPAGRILNRLSKDLGITDETLPLTAFDLNLILGNAIGVIVTVSLVNWYLVIPAVVIFAVVVFLRAMYIVSARDIKRIEGLTRSPIYNHVNVSLSGLASIRAYGAQAAFERQFYRYLDDHSGIWYHYLSFSKFIGIIIDWIVVLYICTITLSVMLTPALAGGYAGLAISSGLLLAGITQYGVRQSTEFETQMTSVERILEYQELETEAPEETSQEVKLPSNWPSTGQIEFDNLSLEYVPGQPVLKKISFKVAGGSKVGVVGRTGAGKSSLVAALFRLTEPSGGCIRLDGIETAKVGLTDLRKKISIIPQDPVIFSGSVRYNLDPFDEFTDEQLWAALEEVQLKKTVTGYKGGLEEALTDGGGNLSCGERQLLCLARALLRQNKVLVLDEATAAVDHETDGLIQRTIRRSQFANCTLITIAHRLNTIIDCDRVLVLDGGEVLEYDVPLRLLDQRGAFYQMCKKTGPSMYAHLYEAAKEAASRKVYSKGV